MTNLLGFFPHPSKFDCMQSESNYLMHSMVLFRSRIVRSALQHVKNLYGIKIEVKGLENLNVKGPYVIISNHQSSLDLMGKDGLPVCCLSPL